MIRPRTWTMLLLAVLAAPASGADLVLLPSSATLTGPKSSQRFLVEARDGGALVADRTTKAAFAVDDPKVATVSGDGIVTPKGDGTTTLTAIVEGQAARAAITIKDFGRDTTWSFQNHILPVLT